MKVILTIECDTISELQAHLSVVKEQLRRHVKKTKMNPSQDDLPKGILAGLSDNNCYGTHYTKVINS